MPWTLPEEQKECCQWVRSTGELLYIDQHILKDNRKKGKNLARAWTDNKKSICYDNWIIDCLKINTTSGGVMKFIKNRVELTAGGKSLTEVKIQRWIFQRDLISPLLFVIVMVPLNHQIRKCTGLYKLHKLQKKIN